MANSLRHRPQILRRLREQELLAGAKGDARAGKPAQLPAPSRSRLSPAELRVVDRLAAGRTPQQIARELGVTINTVRSHLKEAKRKTGSRTLDELVGLHVVEEGRL